MAKYDLLSISTEAPDGFKKKKTRAKMKAYGERLRELQNMLYAEGKWSVLVVLQGMDASGKDGATRKVFDYVNPQGIQVKSFKKPTPEEMAHDYLWRVHQHTPKKGMIQVFNRSHYEEVLITRVEGWVDDETAHRRFAHINAFEQLLQDHGTKILKFYLHISEEAQQESFYDRIVDPRKQWKYGPEDFDKAKKWPLYRKAYEDVLEHCSPEIPWIIVPSDNNWYKEYIIMKTVVETLESLNMKYPKAEVDFNSEEVQALMDKFGNKDH